MTITLIAIGKTDNKQLQLLIDDYKKRLGHYIKFNFEIIADLKNPKHLSEAQQKQKEAKIISTTSPAIRAASGCSFKPDLAPPPPPGSPCAASSPATPDCSRAATTTSCRTWPLPSHSR